jgi:hypothetical protein
MLVSKQLTDRLLDNARITRRKEPLEIRHKLSQHHVYLSHVEEHTAGRKTVASVIALGTLFNPNNPAKGTA